MAQKSKSYKRKKYKPEDYDVDGNWGTFRSEMRFDPTQWGSEQEVRDAINEGFNSMGNDGYGRFGSGGRELFIQQALDEWNELTIPPTPPTPPEEPTKDKVTSSVSEARASTVEPSGGDTFRPDDITDSGADFPDVVPPEGSTMPTVVTPESEVPPDVEEVPQLGPGERMNATINRLRTTISNNASYKRVRTVVINTGQSMRDSINNVVSRLRGRLGL